MYAGKIRLDRQRGGAGRAQRGVICVGAGRDGRSPRTGGWRTGAWSKRGGWSWRARAISTTGAGGSGRRAHGPEGDGPSLSNTADEVLGLDGPARLMRRSRATSLPIRGKVRTGFRVFSTCRATNRRGKVHRSAARIDDRKVRERRSVLRFRHWPSPERTFSPAFRFRTPDGRRLFGTSGTNYQRIALLAASAGRSDVAMAYEIAAVAANAMEQMIRPSTGKVSVDAALDIAVSTISSQTSIPKPVLFEISERLAKPLLSPVVKEIDSAIHR